MAYVRSASAQKFIDKASTKLICWYHDNNIRTYHGRPKLPNARIAADPYAVEMLRHQRYVKKEAAAIRTACIYDLNTGDELAKFSKGAWV